MPSNFFVNNLLTAKVFCESCDSEDAAKRRCNDCGIYLCQFCVEFHKRSRLLKHHELLTVEQLKSKKIAEKIRCSKHKEEIIQLFCKTCQTTACRDCIIADHRQHKYGFVEEVADEEKQHLLQNLGEVKQRKDVLVQGIMNLEKFEDTLKANNNSITSEISHHFDELAKNVAESLECCRKVMTAKAASLTNSKQKKIRAQLQVLEVALARCENSIEFTERALSNGDDIQIASMSNYILQSLGQLKDVKDQTNPSVTENMMFVVRSSVKETKEKLLNEYDVIGAVVNVQNCQASFSLDPREMERDMKIDQQYSITLVCCDKSNQGLEGQHIKPSFTGMYVSDVVVTDNKDGSYTINFCPRQGGMLKFEVSINGIPAPSCSLIKQVKWVISNAHGKGVIVHRGLTMKGKSVEGKYCWRVGECYFESGVHTWKIRVNGYRRGSTFQNQVHSSVEVGIIDYSKINKNDDEGGTKWVYKHKAEQSSEICLSLDMEKRTLKVMVSSDNYGGSQCVKNCQFTAQRVSSFFACSSPYMSLNLVE